MYLSHLVSEVMEIVVVMKIVLEPKQTKQID